MRHAYSGERPEVANKLMVFDLKEKLRSSLRKATAECGRTEWTSFLELKKYLIEVDYEQRVINKNRAERKVQAYADQCIRAKAEIT